MEQTRRPSPGWRPPTTTFAVGWASTNLRLPTARFQPTPIPIPLWGAGHASARHDRPGERRDPDALGELGRIGTEGTLHFVPTLLRQEEFMPEPNLFVCGRNRTAADARASRQFARIYRLPDAGDLHSRQRSAHRGDLCRWPHRGLRAVSSSLPAIVDTSSARDSRILLVHVIVGQFG